MKPPTLKTITVRRLRRHLQGREFAIPKLQRNFVWDPSRAAKLLDSMYRAMPIGSLFLWEMDRKSANLIRQSTGVLPAFNSKNRRILFVIDGQQRLSVIYQAFEGQQKENDAGRLIDFGRLCFVPEPDEESDSPMRVVYRKPVDGELVPLKDILASDWRSRMPIRRKSFLGKIRRARRQLLSYPVPVVTVRSATLDEIGEIFVRVNSEGKPVTSADRAIALMGELDLRAMAQELRQRVRESGFKLGSIDPILMGFNLIAEPPSDGDPPKLDAMARRWQKRLEKKESEKEAFRKIWHRYQRGFQSAIDYLRDRFPVHDETYLPSLNMLATLAVFFYNHAGQPTTYQAGEIRKWFWATGVAQRYTGRGYHNNIMADGRLFESLARGARKRFSFKDRLDPILEIQGAEYGSRSARARAFFCLLSSLRPRYLENGEPITSAGTVLSHANLRNRHHLFPRAQLLKARLSPRAYNSLCNICFLVSRDNQKIGKRLPRKYLTEYRDLGRRRFNAVMKSHLIPVGGESGVWDRGVVRGYKAFRKSRLPLICAAFEKAAGIKLFRQD